MITDQIVDVTPHAASPTSQKAVSKKELLIIAILLAVLAVMLIVAFLPQTEEAASADNTADTATPTVNQDDQAQPVASAKPTVSASYDIVPLGSQMYRSEQPYEGKYLQFQSLEGAVVDDTVNGQTTHFIRILNPAGTPVDRLTYTYKISGELESECDLYSDYTEEQSGTYEIEGSQVGYRTCKNKAGSFFISVLLNDKEKFEAAVTRSGEVNDLPNGIAELQRILATVKHV